MNEKLVCASIIEETFEDTVSVAAGTRADLVELRLDYLREKPDFSKIKEIKKPVIAACMPSWEGGRFEGSEEERVRLLKDSLPFIQYVTIELNTGAGLRDALVDKAKEKGVKVIVAYHDFEETPPLDEIKDTLKRELEAGADVAKVAFTPKNTGDVLAVLQATAEHTLSIPVITLSMGELGRASRIIGPLLGSHLTYAAAAGDKKAAPGQLTVDELKKILTTISG